MGAPRSARGSTSYDGKDYPIYSQANLPLLFTTGVKPGTQAYRVVDANTVELTPKDNTGKITFNGIRTRAVSRDGKTLTDIQKGTNAQGQVVDIVQIFDKLELESVRSKSPVKVIRLSRDSRSLTRLGDPAHVGFCDDRGMTTDLLTSFSNQLADAVAAAAPVGRPGPGPAAAGQRPRVR